MNSNPIEKSTDYSRSSLTLTGSYDKLDNSKVGFYRNILYRQSEKRTISSDVL